MNVDKGIAEHLNIGMGLVSGIFVGADRSFQIVENIICNKNIEVWRSVVAGPVLVEAARVLIGGIEVTSICFYSYKGPPLNE